MSNDTTPTIPQTLNQFGKAWIFQEDYTGRPKELESAKKFWKENAGHSCMVIKKTRLYVTQLKTRTW